MSSVSGTFLGELSDRQEAVQQEARAFLLREWPLRAYRELIDGPLGYSPELWQKLCALGWPGITLPESLGGADGTFAELAALAEELGRALAPAPLAVSAAAAFAVERSDNPTLRHAAARKAASGEGPLTLAVRERELQKDPLSVSLGAHRTEDGFRLDGMKLFVPFAGTAAAMVTAARLDDRSLALVLVDREAPGVQLRRLKPLDWSPLFEVTYNDVLVREEGLLISGDAAEVLLEETLMRESLTTCAELLGVAKGALDLAVGYANNRVAFGRPIGSFQAVKHRLVNLRIEIEIAAALLQAAVHDIVTDAPGRSVTAARVAFWCVDTLRKVPEGALQVFGGIGFTWEHDIHLYLRRAATLSALLGEPSHYRDVVVENLA
ncbi:MAG: acyl-CoA dehydrogenase family protein [Dehalococcoidia bacterium]